jgi:hypothetical protein
VGCYLWDPNWRPPKPLTERQQKELVMQGAAYDGVPKEGERVRVYARHRWSKYLGVYPNWYDPLPGK